MNNNQENRIQYNIQYLSSWFYHNVLYTETATVLLKFIVFVILLSLIVYQQYYYFACGAAFVIVYLFFREGPGAVGTAGTAGAEWHWPSMDNAVRRVAKDELTIGVPLVNEGFAIAMPKIIKGDDSGKDYHRSNKFIEEDSRDFTEKYFNSKKCGIGSGIGGITMFGSNELIGGERKVVLSGLYDFSGNWGNRDMNGTTPDINKQRYKYFKDCVFIPVKRSLDNGGGDFRDIKTTMCDNINNKIININRILERFDWKILFDTQTDPNSDYNQRVSLSNNDQTGVAITPNDKQKITYNSLIKGSDNESKFKNIKSVGDGDDIDGKLYAELLTTINNNRTMNSSVRQRHLDIYAKAYGIRNSLDSIFANMRTQTKNDASLMYTVRIGESVVQQMRTMLSYLAIIQRTNDIIQFEKHIGSNQNGNIYDLATPGLPPTGELGVIPIAANDVTYRPKISGGNNIFKIPLEDDTYNNNDEKRYLYGITYYFDTANSKP